MNIRDLQAQVMERLDEPDVSTLQRVVAEDRRDLFLTMFERAYSEITVWVEALHRGWR